MAETLAYGLRDGVLSVTLARPGALNAVDLAMAREMPTLGRKARVIVLTGAELAFMAGGDVRAFERNLGGMGPFIRELIDGFHAFIAALAEAPQPVLASINGAAAGGGLSLALACDLAIVAAGAKLAFAYRQLGTSPDGGSTYSLPRMMGSKRAAELLLARDAIPADEALSLGLVNWVMPSEHLRVETARIAAILASNAAEANARTKRLLRGSLRHSLAEQLAAERDAFDACAATADFAEGVRAFVTKRAPKFNAAQG